LALELATLRKEEAEAKRLLTLATPRAERAGVLTWTLAEEGVSIRKGDIVGRIADLGSFRVDATVSDVHARRLSAGMPVHVRVGETSLTGTIATVHPTVDNGAIKLTVSLADRSHRALRANQRVDVLIVTGHKDRVLQIAKGPFADGEGPAQVFVVRDARAVRTPVRIGLVSFETFEIVDGLAEGDEAIVSDMRDYLHMAEVRIR
jgi:HlyD family secretion protein